MRELVGSLTLLALLALGWGASAVVIQCPDGTTCAVEKATDCQCVEACADGSFVIRGRGQCWQPVGPPRAEQTTPAPTPAKADRNWLLPILVGVVLVVILLAILFKLSWMIAFIGALVGTFLWIFAWTLDVAPAQGAVAALAVGAAAIPYVLARALDEIRAQRAASKKRG